jgi:hypothetical protein
MSKLNSSGGQDPIAAKLAPTEILYYYDEPLIFTAEARFGPVICSKTDERNGSSEYLVAPTTKSTIEQLRSGSVSLRTAFSQPWCWLVEMDHDFNLLTSAAKTLDTLPSDYLPEAEVGLYSYHGSVPEKVTPRIQHPAYISVRFSGRDLVAETMSFGVFKSLVDEIYVALRKVFLPAFESLISEGISETRAGRLLRIPIRQPKFASLTVEIEEPKVDTSRLRDRIPKDLRHTEEAIEKAGASFLEQMQTIEKMARKRPLTTDVATSYFSTLDALSHIAPIADYPCMSMRV